MIWAAWADRLTFEEIKEDELSKGEVIILMRSQLKEVASHMEKSIDKTLGIASYLRVVGNGLGRTEGFELHESKPFH